MADPSSDKDHMSIVICGHVDSGKSTTTGRLLFDLGGLPERELEKLKQEAERLGKASFAFAFFMDRQKEERERGVTISCTTKEFFTPKWRPRLKRVVRLLAFGRPKARAWRDGIAAGVAWRCCAQQCLRLVRTL